MGPTISFLPSPMPTYSGGCTNTNAGATDSYGDDCLYYDSWEMFCGYYDDEDFTADEMCCSCGGGEGGATPAPTTTVTYSGGCTNTNVGATDPFGDGCLDYDSFTS